MSVQETQPIKKKSRKRLGKFERIARDFSKGATEIKWNNGPFPYITHCKDWIGMFCELYIVMESCVLKQKLREFVQDKERVFEFFHSIQAVVFCLNNCDVVPIPLIEFVKKFGHVRIEENTESFEGFFRPNIKLVGIQTTRGYYQVLRSGLYTKNTFIKVVSPTKTYSPEIGAQISQMLEDP